MIIGKLITCILHMRHAHYFMASFLYIFASKLIIFLGSVLTNLSIPPSDSTLVYDYDHVSKVINTRHPTDHTQHFDSPYFQYQGWKRSRWNYQSFGRSYETTRLGSTFLSRLPYLGTLPFIYFITSVYFCRYLDLVTSPLISL